MPVIFLCILMFALWIRYETTKSNKADASNSEAFWNRESIANHTRNQSIDSLDYIVIPIDKLPLLTACDEELDSLQNTLRMLSTENIVNLSAFSNTDLKLKYGTGRFKTLAQYDENYTLLLQTLEKLAAYHTSHHNPDAAITYYEYAITCKSSNPPVYVNLALLYADQTQGDNNKLAELKQSISASNLPNKDAILRKLEQALLDHLIQ